MYTCARTHTHAACSILAGLRPLTPMCWCARIDMGWLRLAGSWKLQVSFAEYRLFYRALLQKRPRILRSLLIMASVLGGLHPVTEMRWCACICTQYLCAHTFSLATLSPHLPFPAPPLHSHTHKTRTHTLKHPHTRTHSFSPTHTRGRTCTHTHTHIPTHLQKRPTKETKDLQKRRTKETELCLTDRALSLRSSAPPLVCACVYMCVKERESAHTHTCVCVRTHTRVCEYARIRVCVCVCPCTAQLL